MRIRASQIIIATLFWGWWPLAYGQSKWNITTKGYTSISKFHMNKRASIYNNNWSDISVTSNPNWGYGYGLGTEYTINQRTRLFADFRFQHWGSNIYTFNKDNPNKNEFMELQISYKSLHLPIGIKRIFLKKSVYQCFFTVGLGMDYTYRLKFTPENHFGKSRTFNLGVDIQTYYVHAGVGAEFKIGQRLLGIVGTELNNDWLLNPKRYQDFGGNYRQQQIPLSYSMLLLYIGLKLNK